MAAIDQAHTPHFPVGYMFNKIQPRLAMITNLGEDLIPEIIAGMRVRYSGLFQFGAPDLVVVNDAIWTRKAALPEAGTASPKLSELIDLSDLSPTNLEISVPDARQTILYRVADEPDTATSNGSIRLSRCYVTNLSLSKPPTSTCSHGGSP